MAETTTRFPDYVTDGHHIYLWNDEYEVMLADGRLRPSDPPVIPKIPKLNLREKTKLEATRKKALKEAEDAVRLLKAGVLPAAVEEDTTLDLFGSPPHE